jgi:hypothetical protein
MPKKVRGVKKREKRKEKRVFWFCGAVALWDLDSL